MPSYFFDFHDGDAVRRDGIGLDLAGIEAVRTEAINALLDMAGDVLSDGHEKSIAVDVRDNAGQPVLTASLTLVVDVKAG
jgi:hypothetical protein